MKPGGRLIYATCSLLMEEDEDQVAKFLATHADFFLVPIRDIWADVIGGDCPARGDTLRLSPARHGTDGFFVAVMERKPAPKKEAAADEKDEGDAPMEESTDG